MRMKNYMRKSAAFSHVFFTFAFAFLLFLCFFRYLRLPIFLSALFAFAAACCAAALIAAFLGRKRQKLLFSLRAEKEKNALALYLSLASPNEILRFFAQAFPDRFSSYVLHDAAAPGVTSCGVSSCGVSSCGVSSCGVSSYGVSSYGVSSPGVSSCGDHLLFLRAPLRDNFSKNGEISQNAGFSNSDNGDKRQREENYFFSFSAKKFDLEKAENLLRTLGGVFGGVFGGSLGGSLGGKFGEDLRARGAKYSARAYLYCTEIEEEAAALLETFGVKCVAIDEIFAAAKLLGALPEEAVMLANEKKARGFRLRAISKKTARGLLVSAGILLFTSLFSPFPYYYRAMGLILLALSLAVRLLATGAKLPAFRRAAPLGENAHEDNSDENNAGRK